MTRLVNSSTHRRTRTSGHDARVAPAAFDTGGLMAFAVDDVVGARAELAAAGVELVGDMVRAHEMTAGDPNDRCRWFLFRGPDDHIDVIQQDGLPAIE